MRFRKISGIDESCLSSRNAFHDFENQTLEEMP